jgi:hypothetical protein
MAFSNNTPTSSMSLRLQGGQPAGKRLQILHRFGLYIVFCRECTGATALLHQIKTAGKWQVKTSSLTILDQLVISAPQWTTKLMPNIVPILF